MRVASVAIIGAGPAGLAAAIQLQRYGINLLLFEREAVGGLLRNANLVENYPGFPAGISGVQLVRLFEEQLRLAGVQVTCAGVTALCEDGGLFRIETANQAYLARIVVIASGTRPIQLTDFPIPAAARGRVIYEILPVLGCAGLRFAIVGAGDLAFDYALNLGRENQVLILNRGEHVHCLPLLKERAAQNPNITYLHNTRVDQVETSPDGGLVLTCAGMRSVSHLTCDYLIEAIGRKPQLNFISEPFLQRAAHWEQEGMLYFIGDVKNQQYRQASIAIGDGVLSAMQIHQRITQAVEAESYPSDP
jgi:thioredoxin reductase